MEMLEKTFQVCSGENAHQKNGLAWHNYDSFLNRYQCIYGKNGTKYLMGIYL